MRLISLLLSIIICLPVYATKEIKGLPYTLVKDEDTNGVFQSGTVTEDTWFIPDATFTVAVTKGVWEFRLRGFQYCQGVSLTTANVSCYIALGTSTTPGTDLITDWVKSGHADTTHGVPDNAAQYRPFHYVSEPITISGSKSVYLNVRWDEDSGGATTIGGFGIQGTANSPVQITAKKLQ